MSSKFHLNYFTRGGIIGKLEEGHQMKYFARKFNITHSIVSRLWIAFQTTGISTRRMRRYRPSSTTSQENWYIVISSKETDAALGRLASQLSAATETQIPKTFLQDIWKTFDYKPEVLLCVSHAQDVAVATVYSGGMCMEIGLIRLICHVLLG